MKEYRTDKAIVRIHGTVNQERLVKSTETFLKKAEKQRREKK